MAVNEFIIASGESLSEAIEVGEAKFMGLQIPATWDSATVAFQGSGSGSGFQVIGKPEDGTEYVQTVATDKACALDMDILGAWRFLKLQSGDSSSEVAQTGIEASKEIFIDATKSLKFTSGVGGGGSNEVNVSIATNTTDDLAASVSGLDLLIKLASSTAGKNADTLIEAAVQALVDTGSIDLTAMTVTGNAAYDAAPPVGVVATKALTVATGKTLTFASVLKGAAYNAITVTMATAVDDTLVVNKVAGTDGILINLANTTANKNSADAIQTAVQALTATDKSGLVISGMTVTGNGAYNSAPLAGVKATKTIVLDGTGETEKALTFTSGVPGVMGNAIKVTIGVNDSNALAVSAADGVITVLLADTTGASNAASAIETAVRAITGGKVAGVDITGMTVTDSIAYDAAPPVALGAGITVAAVPLATGADSIVAGLISAVPLANGADSILAGLVSHVNLEGGDDCRVKLITK